MSRSYRKPVCKLNNDTEFKKIYNRKIRRKNIILHDGNYYKKLNCCYDICDFNTGVLDPKTIQNWYKDREYKIRRKYHNSN